MATGPVRERTSTSSAYRRSASRRCGSNVVRPVVADRGHAPRLAEARHRDRVCGRQGQAGKVVLRERQHAAVGEGDTAPDLGRGELSALRGTEAAMLHTATVSGVDLMEPHGVLFAGGVQLDGNHDHFEGDRTDQVAVPLMPSVSAAAAPAASGSCSNKLRTALAISAGGAAYATACMG